LLAGNLNFAMITGQDQQRLTSPEFEKLVWKVPAAELWFNHRGDRPTADKQVRQALVAALDPHQVVQVSTGGTGAAASGLSSSDTRPCTGNTIAGRLPAHDVNAAAALLDKSGWVKNGNGMRSRQGKQLSIDLHYVPTLVAGYQATAELIAQQWKALGVQVKLTSDTTAGLNQVMFQTGNYDVYLDGFGTALPNQMAPYLSGPTPPQGSNFSGINNADYNNLVAKAETLVPPAACTYWDEAEQALWREVDVAPLSNGTKPMFVRGARAETNGWNEPIPTSIRMM
jgi:peptide/nickel transport system substrate-binding protein